MPRNQLIAARRLSRAARIVARMMRRDVVFQPYLRRVIAYAAQEVGLDPESATVDALVALAPIGWDLAEAWGPFDQDDLPITEPWAEIVWGREG